MTARILKNSLTAEEKESFARMNKSRGLKPTNDCIELDFGTTKEPLVIFTGRYTPYGAARRTGDKIICARWDRYYKFDLEGNIISLDAEDDTTNR